MWWVLSAHLQMGDLKLKDVISPVQVFPWSWYMPRGGPYDTFSGHLE